jgi:hypothetical protein
MRKTLIKIPCQKSNERRVYPGVGIDATNYVEPIPMSNWSGFRYRQRFSGPAKRMDAGVPEAAHRSAFFVRAVVGFTGHGQCGPGGCRHVGPKTGQGRRFLQHPQKLSASDIRNAVQHHGPPEIKAAAGAGHIGRTPFPELFLQQFLDVSRQDSAGCQFVAIAGFGQERLASEPLPGALDSFFERHVFEGVQRIVVDEYADGALRRQQVCQFIDKTRERMDLFGGTDILKHQTATSFPLALTSIRQRPGTTSGYKDLLL